MSKLITEPVEEKLQAIDRVKSGAKQVDVAHDLKVGESTVRGWMKDEEKLRAFIKGQYDKGCKYFKMTSTIAINLGDLQLLKKAQVYTGKAHQMTAFSRHIEATGHVNTERVLAWKNSRNDMFSDPSAV
ncbi:UNVERIFIED_CONTAM: hypothetical protein FKN15_038480 [Acipenser sinensis]